MAYRRIRGDLIETYKICHKIYDPESVGNLLHFTTQSDLTERTRGHPYNLTKISPNTNNFKYFFSNRVTKAWNSLPVNAACATSLNSFNPSFTKGGGCCNPPCRFFFRRIKTALRIKKSLGVIVLTSFPHVMAKTALKNFHKYRCSTVSK